MAAKDFATQAVLFLLILNAVPTIMAGSGLDEAMGFELDLGIEDTIDEMEEEAGKAFSPNTGVVRSFVSVAIAASKVVQVFFESITAFPALLENLGVPSWLTDPLKVIMSIIALFAVIYVVSGRRFGR